MTFPLLSLASWWYWSRPVVLGILLGALLVIGDGSLSFRSLPPEAMFFNAPVSHLPAGFMPHASYAQAEASYLFEEALLDTLPVEDIPKRSPLVSPRPASPRLPFYEKYVPVPKKVSPNSVRLTKAQAPPPVSAKKVNGKWVCAHKKDKPQKSDQNGRAHVDRQCCLDPDEVPNPHCTY